jgi:hypothetical protein
MFLHIFIYKIKIRQVAVCLTWRSFHNHVSKQMAVLATVPSEHQGIGVEVLRRTFKAPGLVSDMGPVGIVLSLPENIETGITRFAI